VFGVGNLPEKEFDMRQFKRISVSLAAGVLLVVAGCASSPDKGGSSYFDDAATTAKVKKAIFSESSLKVTDVSVSTENKVVQLTGSVKSRAEKAKAAELAAKVDGVKRVKNDLLIKQ
jgi:osmotically-inducible protein OsmY